MTSQKSKKPKFVSPPGVAVHPWINRPDTAVWDNHGNKKHDPEKGVYKTDLRYTSEQFEAPCKQFGGKSFKQWIDELVDESVKNAIEKNPKDRKKIVAYYPYEEETDDTGEPTGEYKVKFRQNAKIKLKDGTVIDVNIPIFDKAGQLIEDPVYGGSILQVSFTVRETWIAADKKAGIRLDLKAARVLKLVKTNLSANDYGFDTEDDDFEDQDFEGQAAGDEGEDDVDF